MESAVVHQHSTCTRIKYPKSDIFGYYNPPKQMLLQYSVKIMSDYLAHDDIKK